MRARHKRELADRENEHSDLQYEHEAERRRADDLQIERDRLQAENDILVARDKLWLQWEARERARLEAEAARETAAKMRSIENPQTEGDLR